jgi:VCBS repeat-containing protein
MQQGSLPEGNSMVSTVIDAYNQFTTTLKDGKQVEMNHTVISKDGKTMTATIKGMGPNGKPIEGLLILEKQ